MTQVESVQLEKTLDLKLKFQFPPPLEIGLSVVGGQGSIVKPQRSLHIKSQPPTQPKTLRKVCCGCVVGGWVVVVQTNISVKLEPKLNKNNFFWVVTKLKLTPFSKEKHLNICTYPPILACKLHKFSDSFKMQSSKNVNYSIFQAFRKPENQRKKQKKEPTVALFQTGQSEEQVFCT